MIAGKKIKEEKVENPDPKADASSAPFDVGKVDASSIVLPSVDDPSVIVQAGGLEVSADEKPVEGGNK